MWPKDLSNLRVLVIGANDDAFVRDVTKAANKVTILHQPNAKLQGIKKVEYRRSVILSDPVTMHLSAGDCYDLVWVNMDINSFTDIEVKSILSNCAQANGSYSLYWSVTAKASDVQEFAPDVWAIGKPRSESHVKELALVPFSNSDNAPVVVQVVCYDVEDSSFGAGPGVFIRYTSSPFQDAFTNLTSTKHSNVTAVWEDERMPLIWRAAVYSGITPVMNDLFASQEVFFQHIFGDSKSASYIEVGCGTAELAAKIHNLCRFSVGVEINPAMIDLARSLHPLLDANEDNYLICGNATELNSIINAKLPTEFWGTSRIVSIMMNTFGILPKEIRQTVIDEMLEMAGADGKVVIGCWHSKQFPIGISEFYQKHPELCGEINMERDIDYNSSDLDVESTGYQSHWFSAGELGAYFDESKYDVEFQTHGIGIFLSASLKAV